MNIEIRKLTPDMLDDYLHFFETDAHADNDDEDRCYCVGWSGADDDESAMSSPEKRREQAIKYVGCGHIQGYLAYCGGKVVGWCNANDKSKCISCRGWKLFMSGVDADGAAPNAKIKSVFCYAIAPGMKRKGIATKLLERVCQDAADEGFDFVEAYPNKKFINIFRDFMGPLELYKRNGFAVCQEVKDKYSDIYVMRKPLKG